MNESLEQAEQMYPDAFAHARHLWIDAGENNFDELALTFLATMEHRGLPFLAFALHPVSVIESFAKGERARPYRWISGELPLPYRAKDFNGHADLCGISIVEE